MLLSRVGKSKAFIEANPHLFGGVVAQKPAQDAPERKSVIRLSKKKMTKAETLVGAMLTHEGRFESVVFEGMRLKIGDGCFYTPDFACWTKDGKLFFVEAKGPYIRPDSIIKFKSAKLIYKHAQFELWQNTRKEGLQKLI